VRIAILSTYSLEGSIPTDSEYGDPDESTYSCGSSLRDGFRKLGHEVDMFSLYDGDNNTGMHRIINAINDGYEPGCVYLMHAGSLRDGLGPLWRRSNFKNIPMIAEGGDEWQCFGWNFEHNRFSDLVLTLDNQCVEWYTRKGVSAAWFPVWADERVYFYDDTKKTQAISTTAVPTKTRNDRGFLQLNDMIAEEFGDDFVNPMRHRQGMEYIPMMDNGDLFRRSKIVFQFSSASEITRRIVEGGACNAFVIADRLPPIRNLQEMFVEDEDIVCYTSAGECLDKLNFYLNNDDERIRIAGNMHQKIMKYHTAPSRAQHFIGHYNRFFGN
jgi:hypothetical protein